MLNPILKSIKFFLSFNPMKILSASFIIFFCIFANANDTAHLKPVINNDYNISITFFDQPQPEYVKKFPGNLTLVKFSFQFDKSINLGFGEPVKFIISDAIIKCQNNTLDLIRDLSFGEKTKLLDEKSYQLDTNKKIWIGASNLINQEIAEKIIKYSCRDKSLDVPQLLLDCETDSKNNTYRFNIDFNSGGIIMDDKHHLFNPIISDIALEGRIAPSRINYFIKISRINGKITFADSSNNIIFSGECKKSTGNKF
jgi:hypothetical protein